MATRSAHHRSSPAVPLLWRPHDHCRGLCPRRRTARPALRRRDQHLSDDPPSLLLSASARWNVSCPAPYPFHPSAGKRRQDTTDQFPISPSNKTPAASSQSSAAFSSQQSSQNRLPATPLPRQIPIDGPAFTAFPWVLSSEAFGRRPYTGSTPPARAGIRNPSGQLSFAGGRSNGEVAPTNEPARAGEEQAARIAPSNRSTEDDGAGVPS